MLHKALNVCSVLLTQIKTVNAIMMHVLFRSHSHIIILRIVHEVHNKKARKHDMFVDI